jgi:hypothetical protein
MRARLVTHLRDALTNDATLAMQAIGDTDSRVMRRFLERREDRVRGAFAKPDVNEISVATDANGNRTETQTGHSLSSDPLTRVKDTYSMRPVGIEPTT